MGILVLMSHAVAHEVRSSSLEAGVRSPCLQAGKHFTNQGPKPADEVFDMAYTFWNRVVVLDDGIMLDDAERIYGNGLDYTLGDV